MGSGKTGCKTNPGFVDTGRSLGSRKAHLIRICRKKGRTGGNLRRRIDLVALSTIVMQFCGVGDTCGVKE